MTEPDTRHSPEPGRSAPNRPNTSATMTDPGDFLVTKQYRRFAEFCDAVRRDRYIGLCYGPPGVGKTISARHYANWDQLQPLHDAMDISYGTALAADASRSVLYTPTVTATPRQLQRDLSKLSEWLSFTLRLAHEDLSKPPSTTPSTELLIIDEADRLKHQTLEQLRDHFDRTGAGLILIGMPGIEKRLSRYPQLYSRIGFAHEYHPLSTKELEFVLQHHYQHIGLTLSADDFTDNEAIAAVAHITNGNFRLIQRLFAQIARILKINNLTTITKEVVETARENLVIGAPQTTRHHDK